VLVGLLLYATRSMERWLYQHLFMVGWLFTHNLPATTISFYLFFLPGIVLHETTVWLVAGIFNVRADRSLAWPPAQSEARLKLEFVRLAKNAGKASLAVIQFSPLVAGMVALYLIVVGILRLDVIAASYTGDVEALPALIQQITRAPDFWLWFYIAFTIANTMFPADMKALHGWRVIFVVVGAFVVLLFVFGLGEVIVGRVLQGPLREAAIVLSGLLGFVIIVDLVATAALGLVESAVELVTGSSATYQNGKLVALTREQVRQQRANQRLQAERKAKAQKAPAVYKTVYDLPLPLPPAPGKAETVTVERPPQPALGGGPAGPGLASPPDAD